MKASWAQVLALLVAVLSASMFAYINFFAPRMKAGATQGAVISTPAPASSQASFRSLKPKRTPSEADVKQALETVAQLYKVENPMVAGDPIVASLTAPESEQLALAYEATNGTAYVSAVEVLDLSATPMQSIYHREGEDFQFYAISAGSGEQAKSYLLVQERTGATGSYLHLSFLEYDGIGKMKEFYALQDLYAAMLYPLQDKLVLERDHAYYEVVKEQALVRLVDYDIKGRLGFHVVTYGFQNGAWYARHNQEAVPSADKGLVLSPGEEVFLVSDPRSEQRSVRTLVDGTGLEYVKGPPVHILAGSKGEGIIRFLSDAEGVSEFAVPIRVATKKASS